MTRDMNVYGKLKDVTTYVKKLLLLAMLLIGSTGAWSITITYHIINLGQLNNEGQLTGNRTEALSFTSDNATLGVPAAYKSPLAKNWAYYKSDEINYNPTTKAYTFAGSTTLTEGATLDADADIYVTYELDDTKFNTVGITDGGVCNIKFNDSNNYLYQSVYQGDPNTGEGVLPSSTASNYSSYLWKFNIKDPYQITIQSKSTSYFNYYLSAKEGGFGDIRLKNSLSTAKNNKVWAFGILPGVASNTFRLIVTDGYTMSPNLEGRDEFGHGYLNDNSKTRYHNYQGSSYSKCDLVFEAITQTYTYHIVDRSGNIAIKYTMPSATPMGQALNSYTDIPEAIRSPYLANESVSFYTFSGDYTPSKLATENKITETSSTTDIYVTYTVGHLSEKFLKLNGAQALNVTVNGDYVHDSGTAGSGALDHKASPTDDEKSSGNYLWFFSGEDPYAMEIRNAGTRNYIGFTTPSTLSLETSPTHKKFILMSGSTNDFGDPRTYEQMELMAATGDDNYYRVGRTGDAFNISTTATGDASLQVRTYLNASSVTYYLIDQAGKVLLEIPSTAESVALPSDWQSPLVSDYHYWKSSAFNTYGEGENKIYKLKETTEASDQVNSTLDADDGIIYVTYDVNDNIIFDISDDDKTHEAIYTTYMLKFYGGEEFYQENGSDGVMTTTEQAVYPYSNGDAMLYVYGEPHHNTQFSSGASTRPRWLWYVVSPADPKVETSADVFESVTPNYKGDPYHVKIMSHSGQASSHNYFRTYAVNYGGSNHIVTGVTTKNEKVDKDHANQLPTEYMILKAPNNHSKLVTVKTVPVDLNGDGDTEDEGENERCAVTSFEQYWKNNPTVQNKLGNAAVTETESYNDDIQLTTTQQNQLPIYWHTYQAFANAAPWVGWKDDNTGTGKQYMNKHHWFQTIDMGSTGEFTFEATTLEPQVILLDNHGWEIMRAPLSDATTLRKYDSPMVETYHWYPTASKVTGYHKYNVSDPVITVYSSYLDENNKTKWKDSGDDYTHTSTTLADIPYDHINSTANSNWETQPASVKTDFYVTYDVKPEYARLYAGAATESATIASTFLIKQGSDYAKIEGTSLKQSDTVSSDMEAITDDLKWYLKPNFNIDEEMGYQYDVAKVDTRDNDGNALTSHIADKAETNADYVTAGKHGFDPYNLQIQSVANTYYYFTTETSGSHLDGGVWTGSTTDLTLQNLHDDRQTATGYDQTTLNITNATFMVVDDGSGNMRLMPRFDHTKVVNSFSGSKMTTLAAANQYLTITLTPKVVHSSVELSVLGGNYILASDFVFSDDFESIGTEANPFTGSIDGRYHTFSGLSVPLLGYAKDAVVKNLILDDVNISINDGNAGAIAANALGETRIYNCGILSGSVGGSGKVGGIVGLLDYVDGNDNTNKGSRVINCFSYATITGGADVGGIVGYNNYASKASDIRTMVMNCMFYGDITGGTNVSPIYGGQNINNLHGGLNTYNYYSYENLKTKEITNNKYNCALAVEEKYLTRFEFYRQLLNSNKKLAALYASSSSATVAANDMMKWVLETADKSITTPKPYPVLKEQGYYPSIINYDTRNLADYSEANRNKGLKTGTLTVTISGVGSNAATGASLKDADGNEISTSRKLTLIRTDKDFERFNFNYDKVQLPYYNDVGTKNYTDGKVVTGWKITGITAVADDPYTSSNYPATGITDYPDHNYADRKSSNKDLYSVSGRVFSQGAYFDVPYGVTEITIEPYWGKAAYVADEYFDVVYNTNYTSQNVTQLGRQFGTNVFNNDSKQKVYTSIGNALNALKDVTNPTVYDYAIVLVGNLHLSGSVSEGTKPFTMMSVDLDKDNEPDYSFIYSGSTRHKCSPLRFDFLNVPGTAMAQKPNTATQLRNAAVFKTQGWFEITNTSLMYFSQYEYENLEGVTKSESPLILLGGVIDQFVSTQKSDVNGKTVYIHVGSNVWFNTFSMGTHGDGSKSTPHVPVSVTGGDYDSFYLTGTYNPGAGIRDDNAECYVSGGRFGEMAGAGQEQIGSTGSMNNGNIHWQIYDADIQEFYGGGINDAKPVQGIIVTDIFNSHVELFCGGPKFGNMASGKKVTTNATGCTFDKFFGAGNGGNSYSRKKYYDKDNYTTWGSFNTWYNTDKEKYFDGKTTASTQTGTDYGKKGPGVATDFDYEFFVWTSGKVGTRFYINFASFSLAQCNDVESNLKGCTVNKSFYGGGNLGSVTGTAKSVLDDCTVIGNVFGGGYSATLPKIPVRSGAFTENPNFNTSSGMFEPGTISATTDYEWKQVAEYPVNGNNGTEDGKYVYTTTDLTALGKVGHTDLTIKGNTKVSGIVEGETTGGVFGGGDMSAVNGNTVVKIEATEATDGVMNVYGGGNTADVGGYTEVNINGGKVSQDVYGGGKGQTTVVGGNVEVNIGTKDGSTYTGTGTVSGDVYGGSALGAVNAKKENGSTVYSGTDETPKTTQVNIYAGTVKGSVFGGGLGHDDEGETKDVVAQNFGATTVTIENSDNTKAKVETAVYGGSNENGVLKGTATVTITGGTIGTTYESGDIRNVVFGGGFGQPTMVNDNVTVNIGTSGQASGGALLHGNIYGGSALGGVNVSDVSGTPTASTKTDVNLYKGTVYGNVFGGGLGRKAAAASGTAGTEGYVPAITAVAATVGGDVTVTLDGAKLNCTYTGEGVNRTPVTGQIFGANNLNGTPKGHVKVWVKKTIDSTKNEGVARDSRTIYDVAAVYGGGNQADYNPTKATGTDEEKEEAFAEVLIEGCDETSIQYVYGGGNAAAVPATDVTILGDYIIEYVFGGGNGKGEGNPGANIGTFNNGATEYGTGVASTKLVGGHIIYVFGGSDTKGNVRGGTSITMPEKDIYVTKGYDCCSVRDIKEIYGAGNQAEQDGAVTLILGCVNNMDYVYGGARKANVKGGVDLVVTSGHFKGVYGGNDESGTIQGPITLTIEETGCDPLEIDNLYLGGNEAAYSVYGYKEVTDPETGKTSLVARSSMTDGIAVNPPDDDPENEDITERQLYADPVLNIVSCTRIGKTSGEDLGGAFGGGYGAGATLYGNPTVNVNMIPGKFGTDSDNDGKPDVLGTITNVYGGGEQANVEGNTTVNICTVPTVTVRSSMGAPIPLAEQEATAVQGALITENVFGAGKGLDSNVNSALVTGNTTVVMAGGSVAKSVYGGGELSQVGGNTNITVSGGTIGTTGKGGEIYGNIYGGGKGNTTNVLSGRIQGNTNISVSDGTVLHNIYGGGAHGSVGTFTYDGTSGLPTALATANTGKATINITGGEIGTDGHENGMIFGSSRGDIDRPGTIYDQVAWVYDTEVNIGTENDATAGPTIHGSLYGSGENGHTLHDAVVTMHSGTIGNPEQHYQYRGNVYGGGCGTDMYYSTGTETHDGNGDSYNPLAGIVKGTATVLIDGGKVARNVYGAGAMGSVEGSTNVTIGGNAVIGVDGTKNGDDENGYVYAAARGKEGQSALATVGRSSLTISGTSRIKGSAFGGGQNGYVLGTVSVDLAGGTVEHDVYGGGALAQTNTTYGANEPNSAYVTNVTLKGTTIEGALYGGGLGRLPVAGTAAVYTAIASGTTLTLGNKYYTSDTGAGEFTSNGTETANGNNYYELTTAASAAVTAVAADVNGPVTVSVTSGSAANVFGCNNLNGSPKQTVTVEIGAKSGTTLSGTGTISGSVYGGGNLAAYTGSPTVKLFGGTVNTNVFGGGLGATAAVTGNTSVIMEGGTVNHDVYGGGSQADVTGSVNVNISGGKVINDVYGGGALANTNTANWNSTVGNKDLYIDITSLLTIGTSSVYGLYEGAGHTEITNTEQKAETGKTYYVKRTVPGEWADATTTSTGNTTTVTLTGGIVGNVYGGGLGDATTPVYVFGDITLNVNKPSDMTSSSPGVAFTYRSETPTISGVNYTPVPVTGNVFGCNNINGTPMGDVTVGVYSTRQIDESGNYVTGHSPNGVIKSYEIQTVYGGGNQADYLPAEGKGTHVIIDGCGETSISNVYGGGSAASVPATDVVIWGSYDIGYAFGGGNGFYKIKRNDVWTDNDGADVNGLAKIVVHGGKIGEIFGGSDFKGNCLSTSSTQEQLGSCPLVLTKLYGAGKEADVDGNVNVVISACTTENSQIEYVCGGSYKAHISGDVHLTITSGYFKNVYGGNDQRGGIGGNITVDIEETENCEKPIIIQNLVGGGNRAEFPGEDKNGNAFTIDPNNPRKITVNVKSATRIDNVFGGGFLAEANANTEVNINMVRGDKAGKTNVPLPSYYGETGAVLPSNISNVAIGYEEVTGLTPGTSSVVGYYTISGTEGNYTYTAASGIAAEETTYWKQTVTGTIAPTIGTIGNVYGGGNEGEVKGSTIVNIGTSGTVPIMKRDKSGNIVATYDGVGGKIKSITYEDQTVLGAHIDGDVFGGGYIKNVTGSTEVNICAKNGSAVAEGAEKVTIGSSVYGGGNRGDVEGNTSVTMSGGYVFNGIFGGGLAGSVGTFTRDYTQKTDGFDHSTHTCIGKPTICADGTGKCTVVVNGGQIGPKEVATQGMTRAAASGGPVSEGWVWGAGCGLIEDPSVEPDTHFKTYVGSTDVTIGGSAFILESIIGGGEFGRVLNNTLVKIEGGQIGVGANYVDGSDKPLPYSEHLWTEAAEAVTSGDADAIATVAAKMPECSHFDYKSPFAPYDPYYDEFPSTHITPGSTATPTDGQTWIGCVWGGGSGYMPYKKADGTGYEWLRSAGLVEGNTEVRITGGHILSNVYGGNEYTDVGRDDDATTGKTTGKCKITMSGGTIGVPRTAAQKQVHPIGGNLYGAGKGDQRSHFNDFTNVNSVEIEITGGIIYGSVFGGGEDGHVRGNTAITISGGTIGSTGTSSFDGNVFGGGRGFSGTALTAGTITGDAAIAISDGTVLGNVYGGGRMASIGVDFSGTQSATSGQFTEDGGDVTINISGGTIGNDSEASILAAGGHTTGGNVYGGGMGRLTLLDGTPNPLWVKMAQAKSATINISGSATIKSNVYGGPELGTTRDNAYVTIGGTRNKDTGAITPSGSPTINGSVYGGGYGSEETSETYVGTIDAAVDASTTITYRFTPMMYAGCLGGNSFVNISGGTVKNNVYGGGELATVGVIDYLYADGDYVNIKKHTDYNTEFALSWPYDLPYLKDGKATVNITGGRIGTAEVDTTGYVFGGGKGKAMESYAEAFCANVRETDVTIHYSSTPTSITKEEDAFAYFENPSNAGIQGAVYGGGENGHVMENAVVKIQGGIIGYSAYAGGKGVDKYLNKELKDFKTGKFVYDEKVPATAAKAMTYSITAGKVYGNSSITMSGGHVVRNVYGGGYMASIGKGNYAGGKDDYSYVEHFIYNGVDMGPMCGYGEAIPGKLWTPSEGFNPKAAITSTNKPTTWADHFLSSGKATVTITGGTVGTPDGIQEGMPTGNVVGGSRGEPAPNVFNMPVHDYNPVFHVGNINEAEVFIGTAGQTTNSVTAGTTGYAPRIYGSVYGGGRDGHMRRDSKVTVYSGEIGNAYTSDNQTLVGETSLASLQWEHRGNVYGSGSGIGKFEFDYDGNGSISSTDPNETGVSFLAGCVARFSEVDIQGGIIHRNVYGGGSVAGTGFPKFYGQDYEPYKKGDTTEGHGEGYQSMNTVTISGGTIGEAGYGGNVFGASRGEQALELADSRFATAIWTKVDIKPNATPAYSPVIHGDVYGGGELGKVNVDTEVNLTGGTIGSDTYGGDVYGGGKGNESVAANIGGNTTVELNRGVASSAKGCSLKRIFGCNNLNGTPRGHVKVHVHATQHPDKDKIRGEGAKYDKFSNITGYSITDYAGLVTLAGQYNVNVSTYTTILEGSNTDNVKNEALQNMENAVERKELETFASSLRIDITAYQTILDSSTATAAEKSQALADMRNVVANKKYDVKAVYGGGNLALYQPNGYNNNGVLDYRETTENAEVIIDGCELTSIKQVYGGGNAASTPANLLNVYGTYEIDEVFGGGNGKDPYQKASDGNKWYGNPGANVGYYDYMEYNTQYTTASSAEDIKAHGNGATAATAYVAHEKSNATQPEYREANYRYGTGIAETNIKGGRIHNVYGGSNEKGNIRVRALSVYETSTECPVIIDKSYGAGKNAEIDGEARVQLECVDYMGNLFGGATNSDVHSNINLTVTNGHFGAVYGGNDTSGNISGSITVNIREEGCKPIVIDNLYGGGYKAAYSIYGYYNTGETDDNGKAIYAPRTKEKFETDRTAALAGVDMSDETAVNNALLAKGLYGYPKANPQVNVISATKIGNIYGGGYQALVIGNPHVNVNMENGYVTAKYVDEAFASDEHKFAIGEHEETNNGTTYTYTVEDLEAVAGSTHGKAKLAIGTIDNIYGGGNQAEIDGDTYVEIGTGTHYVLTNSAETLETWSPQRNVAKITDCVFGGGLGETATVKGNTYVSMGGGATVGDRIYGGGSLGDVGTLTAIAGADPGNYTWATNTGECHVTISGGTVGLDTPTEEEQGNVFGGGKGGEGSFYCEKGMVHSTNVSIENGIVKGNVYGGGEIGRVEQNTTVTIGLETGASTPVVEGEVFGGGKGLATHGYAALVRGNPTVTVQGDAKLQKSVYGGGEIASVGSYNVADQAYHDAHPDVPTGMPYELKVADSGTCTVIVRGNAEIGPDNMAMAKAAGPDDTGYVFGAGKGILPKAYDYESDTDEHKPKRIDKSSQWEYFADEPHYLTFIETLAMTGATEVTIGDHAFVKGSVYGGSENGHVLNDTKVTIADDCQIGNGYVQMDEDGNRLTAPLAMNRRYTEAEWTAGHLIMGNDDREELRTLVGNTNYVNSLPECASWPYGKNTGTEAAPVMKYLPWDVYDLDANDVPVQASDGHTFYGNVFGGGSGYYPYRRNNAWTKDDDKTAKVGQPVDKDGYSDGVWLRSAGAVYGNAEVNITGGHILTSVYGGNEMTEVGKFDLDGKGQPTIPKTGGTATVKMSGGTLGVPRTLGQIAAHPVTCYLFGAGKGDQRINFNTWTNVNHTVVEVTDGARIYGSVFGGGEDGHVLGNVTLNIQSGKDMTAEEGVNAATTRYPYIGTTGTSYVDGNIFGGGRGFSGDALTAGSVGGNVTVNISDGTILGSVYGGGRLASVGTRFTAVTDPFYGQLQPDKADDPATEDVDETSTHGHVTINISGGTIGNDLEDITVGHPKGGNVFGGSMGRITLLDGSISPIWPKLAQVKTSHINISGTARIKSNVYGGGELGMVRGNAYVTIGGVLGNDNTTISSSETDEPIIMRDVFGGGYGSDDFTTKTTITAGGFVEGEGSGGTQFTFTPMQLAGIVCGDTHVNINRGWVKKCIYGGGEMATVGLVDFTNAKKHESVDDGFGLSWPYELSFIPYDDSGLSDAVGGSTYVNVYGGRLGITGKDFMGPFNADGDPVDAEGQVIEDAKVIKAARLDNGDIYGGGKGLAGDRYDYAFCANVKKTHVTIDYDASDEATPENYKEVKEGDKMSNYTYKYDCVAGAVYGGGDNGHVIEDTEVTLKNGLVGHAIYGGGSGKGTYTVNLNKIGGGGTYPATIYSVTAGKVYGNTHVRMEGGYVVRNIYGGGNMGSVGKGNYAGGTDDFSHFTNAGGTSLSGYGETLSGNLWTTTYQPDESAENYNPAKDNAWQFLNSGKTTVEVLGGQVGHINASDPADTFKDGLPYGNIFGGCRGEAAPNVPSSLTPRYQYCPQFFSGYCNETDVTIGTLATPATGTEGEDGYVPAVAASGPTINGSVYGGGQDGHVRRWTHVKVNGGTIGRPFDATNKSLLQSDDPEGDQWLYRGNVYGAGSGIGEYEYDFSGDGKATAGEKVTIDGREYAETGYSTSAGSVTHFTHVDIKGGTIYRNVVGGGSLASVGPPMMGQTAYPARKGTDASQWGRQTMNTVHIGSADANAAMVTIGEAAGVAAGYGGNVFGGSRGEAAAGSDYGTSVWTMVDILPGSHIIGTVFGGGDAGLVKKDTKVVVYTNTDTTVTDGSRQTIIDGNVFGGGNNAEVKGDADVIVGEPLGSFSEDN